MSDPVRPTPPSPGAPIEDVIAWLRADCAYRDAITNAANRAFDRAFRKALRK